MITIIITSFGFVFMQLATLLQTYRAKLNRHCQRPQLEAPLLVAEYISAGIGMAKWYERHNNLLLQELYLKNTLSELLEQIADPLVDTAIRKQCMDQLFKPLLALKRFYKHHHTSSQQFLKLQRDACQTCQQFNPFY
ncbi:hypothetical protein CWB89_14245 [Pseudoalteromonas piscicida]|uniref:Uncharacterized protein n=1 Tax=Pseudoalteromonas piscicida TaxID=43662 RepID=A0AAQ2EXQ1_PSEO7|nr:MULTISPECIES: hypothetical protein [Pseudoalteromonas]KJY87088.1 hypothetical protein TW75_15270 [Pseudoalteromonas piscicida]TMN41557.1 hypothetical protein CWB95_08375 [Pseudoalteromonas piscicida]TMN44744.1 hypothetical protein CWB94_00320 [Pseudoalteromonas piscicida]TMN47416.1 hypothetical protein CWB92_20080 [Pseudoalteromonas piscicida]TMN49024.1 hypothetical protein CWB91_17395 [Pseudoalteromonas piscicida]